MALIEAITASQAYQRATTVNETNRSDEDNYSRFLFKRMDAEVLLDAICQVTGVEESLPGFRREAGPSSFGTVRYPITFSRPSAALCG